jgi:hypothetical protein
MLSRLDGEEIRLQQLVLSGELNDEGAAIARKLLSESTSNLVSELSGLETDNR